MAPRRLSLPDFSSVEARPWREVGECGYDVPLVSLSDLRRTYDNSELVLDDAADDPIEQFSRWFEQALAVDPDDANAMILATADAAGAPAARVVLLKGCDAQGFTFFTNYQSRKAQDLAANPLAALCFFWPALDRQVRIEGRVERTAENESEAYFASRPRGSQLGAWASAQSQPIADRAALLANLAAIEQRHSEGDVPRPPHWGGFRLIPTMIEFWQGRPDRLHDRLRYVREEASEDAGVWRRERLSP